MELWLYHHHFQHPIITSKQEKVKFENFGVTSFFELTADILAYLTEAREISRQMRQQFLQYLVTYTHTILAKLHTCSKDSPDKN